ncbi:hypothetical protein ACFFTN_06725 [Aminobacter aganoensis]|uniref:Uncharacterized protein n=1 Tax=Aminobacter aganoensis TaxID=83264 RepID=A0A7X0FCN9_9HYPH|nr:hypothetical protein [Aminobacter aganoensis]MBB6357280.1 hypothetical protein [Aminobacter aganoensis]
MSNRSLLPPDLRSASKFSAGCSANHPQLFAGMVDPALVQAQAWSLARKRTLALCRRQQKLEGKLARIAGFPAATFPPLCDDQTSDAVRQQTRWQIKDAQLGYSRAKEAEQRAADTQQQILEQLTATPVATLEGVIAKLEVVLLEGKDCEGDPQFPWPHIRSIIDDLKNFADHPVNIEK